MTKNGDLYLFGKDSTQCDWSGQVIELKGQHVVQVALGKAHIVALTRDGDVYTFGMNNKGQCGRDFTAPRDPATALGIIPSSRYLLFFITNFRFRFLVLSFDEKKLTLCFDMKNGASSLTSGFENQLPAR